jgi:hypothetical protein
MGLRFGSIGVFEVIFLNMPLFREVGRFYCSDSFVVLQESAMQIQIEPPQAPAVNAADWRALAERRVRFVMRRLQSELMRVEVRLVDVNGPRGGVDQRCQLSLTTEAHGTVVVSAVRGQAAGALNAALRRAASALMRLWQRQRRPARLGARQMRMDLLAES